VSLRRRYRGVSIYSAAHDRFALNFAGTPIRFLRDAAGRIPALEQTMSVSRTLHPDRAQ